MTITSKDIREGQAVVKGALLEMAILDKAELGFSFFAYCSPEQGGHRGRVKFAATKTDLKTTKSFSVSLDDPKVVAGTPPDQATGDKAIAWVKANGDALRKFWSDPSSLTTRDFLSSLKPI